MRRTSRRKHPKTVDRKRRAPARTREQSFRPRPERVTSLVKLRNQLYHGRIEDLLPMIPSDSVDCILADPDYNVGRHYGDSSSKMSNDEYQQWCINWSEECLRVLKPTGNMFIINYPVNNAHLRAGFLDSHFARVLEYVWIYNSNIGHGSHQFTTAHRSILHCTKSRNNRFYKRPVAQQYQNPNARRERKLLEEGSAGRMPYSWMYFDLVKNTSRAKTFHSCQIPESLTEMLLKATTRKSDVVLVLFGGSGSEIAVCVRLGRVFISAEMNADYVRLIRSRLANGGRIPDRYRLKM
jgi:site-specific DNA-methyltransferase (adenine-specific)